MTPDSAQAREKPVIEAYAMEREAVMTALHASEQGLGSETVRMRQAQYGPNTLPLKASRPAWLRFINQFQNVLLYLLIGSGIISLLLQHLVDASVIFAVVLINGIVGYIQEGKAELALRSIMSMARTTCTVIRDGSEISLDSEQLVPGDVVILQAGDRIPADMRLLFQRDLQCDESALTGESQPVEKDTATLAAGRDLAERTNMAYMGTMATAGTGRGVVTRTGVATEIGTINELVQTVVLTPTPLQLQLQRFAQQLTALIILLSAAVMLFGVLVRQYQFTDMFQAAIGIAVASIPEAMPAVVTITLAIGVMNMAHRQALVRRLPAVEVLGSVDVICADKTGTLTANVMSERELITSSSAFQADGEGYSPTGTITDMASGQVSTCNDNTELFQAAMISTLCNEAAIEEIENTWHVVGDPTEGALLVFAIKSGLVKSEIEDAQPRTNILPFDAEHRYMATSHRSTDGEHWLAIKGAPDSLLELCTNQFTESGIKPIDYEYWESQLQRIAAQGMRVIALARKQLPDSTSELQHDSVQSDLVLVGLAGISDPPRAEAIESISQCHRAGIRVKMITGDNPITAGAIGKELGLDTTTVMTGRELSHLHRSELATVAEQVDIFARTSPTNKLQLVEALQLQGHVVAMTGDGVNDAPALRKADIGIAMGKRGTDVAREAADFVLTDDNFSTIACAVGAGRTVYDNILKSIIFILPTSIAEAAVITVAILMGLVLPMTPAQVLWVNMITAITLALALVVEQQEADVMERPPRLSHQNIIGIAMLRRLLIVGATGALVVYLLFQSYVNSGASIEYARSVAVTALVLIEAFYLLNCRFLYQSIFHPRLLGGIGPSAMAIVAVVILQIGFCYLPFTQQMFGVDAISLRDWLVIAASASSIVFIVELEKLFTSKPWQSKPQDTVA